MSAIVHANFRKRRDYGIMPSCKTGVILRRHGTMKKLAFVACMAVAASATIPAFAGNADFAVTVNGTRADLAFDAAPYAREI